MAKFRFEYGITLFYLLLGGAWILFTDRILMSLVDDPERLTEIQTFKGWFYVVITALFFYIFLRRHLQKLRRAEARALESDRLKSGFLANVSHEIRTPMNGVMGFAELLKDPELTHEERLEYIAVIEESGERMLGLLHNLVNISKIDAGQMKVTLTQVDVNELLENVRLLYSLKAEQKGIRIDIKPGITVNEEAIIWTDREKLTSVLTNLLINGITYTDEGYVEMGYVTSGNNLLFYVKDTGVGIELSKQEEIFERFVQINMTYTKTHDGAGLGLSIVRSYVELLGGKVWVKSAPGDGSSFYFTIPYKRSNALSSKKSQSGI